MTRSYLQAADILPMNRYAELRAQIRKQLLPLKQKRRLAIGPHAMVFFECYETIWQQVHEMLYIEKAAPEQIADELDTYNPLIPKGSDLRFTLMFEIEDPVARLKFLQKISHVEEHVFLQCGATKIAAVPIGDEERTRDDGKTSAVHFLKFTIPEPSRQLFLADETLLIGIDHPDYHHLAAITPELKNQLAGDLLLTDCPRVELPY